MVKEKKAAGAASRMGGRDDLASLIDTVTRIADTFGGIHMEGMAESKSLEIE
jgi:hypothetical protein